MGSALTTVNAGTAINGKSLLDKHCARCHSIEATGDSPLKKAPSFREVYLSYPIQQLEGGLAEGMGSRQREMPQIQFSPEQVSAILDYLGSITGVPPSQRPRFDIPGAETIGP
jgi:mono/diheme cytochrome c family protein